MNASNIPIEITCTIDDAFVYSLAVMLTSLFKNNTDNRIKVHLFSASLSENNIYKIKELVTSYHQAFKFYRLESLLFEGLYITERVSLAAYYRILIPEIIDPEVERYIYLDSDLIVMGDISSLFYENMNDNVIGAVNDIAGIDSNMHVKHDISEKYLYFNSGVLLVDRKKWREYDITNKSIAYLKENYEKCKNFDQDGLNVILFNQRHQLSPVWNQQIGLFFIEENVLNNVYRNDYWEAIIHPKIVHFNGYEKPWHYTSFHPYQKQFNFYAQSVSELEMHDVLTLKKVIKKHLLYRILGWKKVKRYNYYKFKNKTDDTQ
jgi:lipopolysaccharide biosynthesis glycosyltransferase